MRSKRNERRSRIEAAFEVLRSRIATALGAAEHEHTRALAATRQREHALRIAETGLAAAERDPTAAGDDGSAEFRAALRDAQQQRAQAFAEWEATGPGELRALVDEAAPGAAGLPWAEWLGSTGDADPADPPGLWRIGTASVPDSPEPEQFPAALPMLDEAHLRITTGAGSGDSAEDLVQNLLLRALSHFQPGMVRVHVWDVTQLTGTLPGLHPLTSAGLLTVHDPTRLDEMLDALSDHIRRIHTGSLLGGHTSLRGLAAETGRRTEPWRIAVLFGDGEQLREEQQQQLQRIARNGLACGIQLIVVDVSLTINSAIESVRLPSDGPVRTSTTGPETEVQLDPAPDRSRVTTACSAIAEAFQARRARVRTLDDLLPERFWAGTSTTGLQAPVGFSEGEQVDITLGDSSPHMLIGGPSGSGKTNFLYGMLGSLAARYGPEELELYLLDFKEGVSFAQFTPGKRDPSWLPHARLVGVNVNTDREFGLALLRFLSEEMRRRAEAAKEHEVTKLEELRGEDPGGRWPRIVAVIDEFQYLFAERDPVTAQATTLLEDVARRGRSQGIHLVLASQDVSGIEAFWGKPATFEQFILRIALPKARRALADQNSAAMELPRWHAVVNHESGVRHGNEIARIPDATAKKTFDRLQQQLWERRDPAAEPPILFDGSLLPELAEQADYAALRAPTTTPRVLLGRVIDVHGTAAAVRLARSPGRNIAVIGSEAEDTTSALGAAALSLGRQHRPGEIRFTVAGLVDEVTEQVRGVVAALRAQGHDVEHVGADGIEAAVAATAAELDERSGSDVPHCLLLHGVDAVHGRMEAKDPQTRLSRLDDLRKVLKQGPELGVHVIGWWRSTQRVKNTLGMGPVDDIGAWVAFDVQGQELSTFAAGQVVNWSPRARRGLFFDRSVHSRPEVVLPLRLPAPGAAIVPEPRTEGARPEIREEAGE